MNMPVYIKTNLQLLKNIQMNMQGMTNQSKDDLIKIIFTLMLIPFGLS